MNKSRKRKKAISGIKYIPYNIILISSFALALVAIIFFSRYLTQNKQRLDASAENLDCSGHPNDPQGNSNDYACDQHIKPCGWNCAKQASCCDEIAKGADPYVCCFEARRWCKPEQCAGGHAEGDRGRCGQIWDLGLCTAVPSNTPIPISPTIAVIPTISVPTVIPPTLFSTPIPTLETPSIVATQIPISQSTQPPKRLIDIPTQAPIVIAPTHTPAPTSKPILTKIAQNTTTFLQKVQEILSKLLATILP